MGRSAMLKEPSDLVVAETARFGRDGASPDYNIWHNRTAAISDGAIHRVQGLLGKCKLRKRSKNDECDE